MVYATRCNTKCNTIFNYKNMPELCHILQFHPLLKKAYAAIVNIHFWKFSCENLPWVCVHETDGTTTGIYNVTTLPTFFLVNRDNEIVMRSDFMEGTLEENILKLL